MTISSVTKTATTITATTSKFSAATTSTGIELTDAVGAVIRRKNEVVGGAMPVGAPFTVTITGLTANTLYRLRMYAEDVALADL
jgi:LytS/YehU family sensor histidine kinase